MSNMIPLPPSRVQIGGQSGSQGGGGTSGPGGASSGPDMEAVRQHLLKAIDELDAAAEAEGDDQDTATIKQLSAKIHALIGAHSAMVDTAMGAGPGVKLMRKAAPAGGGSGPGY